MNHFFVHLFLLFFLRVNNEKILPFRKGHVSIFYSIFFCFVELMGKSRGRLLQMFFVKEKPDGYEERKEIIEK